LGKLATDFASYLQNVLKLPRGERVAIMMPHPERVFRTVSNSWHPEEWGEDGAWMRVFRNARGVKDNADT